MRQRGAASTRRVVGDPAPARLARGSSVGLFSGACAAVAHQVTGGQATPGVATAVVVVSVAAGVSVARWRVGMPIALGLAILAQLASHLLMAGSAAGHVHGGHAGSMPGGADGGIAMLVGHLAVAVVTAALSRRADQALLDLVRSLVSWFLAPTRLGPAPLVAGHRPPLSDLRLVPASVRLVAPVGQRGPPVQRSFLTSMP